LSEEKVVRIHDAAIEVLEKKGIKVATESARKLLADAGCMVSRGSDIVKVPRRIVEDAIALCVKEIKIYNRESVEFMHLGGRRTYFGIGITCIYFRDV
jgi:trimethylamine--corrinoid protein Co-methyltransferase